MTKSALFREFLLFLPFEVLIDMRVTNLAIFATTDTPVNDDAGLPTGSVLISWMVFSINSASMNILVCAD